MFNDETIRQASQFIARLRKIDDIEDAASSEIEKNRAKIEYCKEMQEYIQFQLDILKPFIQEEREACAKLCEKNTYRYTGDVLARLIRARSDGK